MYGAAKDNGNGLFTALTYLGPAAGTNVLKGVLGKADDVGLVAANIDNVGNVVKATSHVDDVAGAARSVADDVGKTADDATSATPKNVNNGNTPAAQLGKKVYKEYRMNEVLGKNRINEYRLPSGKRFDFLHLK